jgi:hypothetical protein
MRCHLFAPLAASAVLAVLVAACGGSATAAPSAAAPSAAESVTPSVAPSPSAEASATPAESTAPDASGAIPSIALPSFTPDKALEALLPSTFDGAPLQKISFKGAQFLGQDPTSDFNKTVTALGLNASDVSMAAAVDAAVQFVAIRFAGADSGKLLQVFQAASQASGELIGSVNLGGKDVIKTKDSSGSFSYLYVRNDVVLGVTTKDDATAAKALAVLP